MASIHEATRSEWKRIMGERDKEMQMGDVINSNDRITVPVNDGDRQEVNGHTGGLLLMQEELAARDQRIAELESDNTRLREALEKTKKSLVKYLRNTDALIYTEAAALVLKIHQALAPQPAKEGE